MIFEKARQTAPCYLVFEDLDSLVNDQVRSYFLNEVDGLQNNDGIFMIGSTNHLERLDPGISKRPSRFDRKYLFPNPDHDQRVAYCHYWQGKLSNNDDIEFPDELCNAIADITDKFSFAYMQEAFVASLLAIAARDKRTTTTTTTRGNNISFSKLRGGGDEDIENNEFWKELKKQIKILREGLEDSDGEASTAMENNFGRMHIGR